MKRPRMVPRPPGKGGTVQLFTYGPLEFDVTRAAELAKKYTRRPRQPQEMVGPNIEINPEHVEQSDPGQPVLFATLVMDGHPWELLIDGNHRILKALRYHSPVQAVVLELKGTLKVLSGPPAMIDQMRVIGGRLGLLGRA